MTRVLVVDDSAFMRHSISRVLMGHAEIEVVGTAADGIEALEMVRRLRPDVVTLDVEMPRMDGLQALQIMMRDMPLPVVMLSSLTEAGAPATIRALELGAVDFVTKPAMPAVGVARAEEELLRAIRAAALAKPKRVAAPAPAPAAGNGAPRLTAAGDGRPAERLVAIGCSTGGPKALLEVIPHLPADLPAGVVVVQHMPAGFTRSLAARLDDASPLHVKEAQNGDVAAAGAVLLAPGGWHMELDAEMRVRLHDGPTVHGVRPAVDVLFRTLPPLVGAHCVAAVLTGMGSDGADGAALIRAAGGKVIAEDASTTVVYGMPRAVAERGLADRQLPLGEIAGAIAELVAEDVRGGRAQRRPGRTVQVG